MSDLERTRELVRRYTDQFAVLRYAQNPSARSQAETYLTDLVEQAHALRLDIYDAGGQRLEDAKRNGVLETLTPLAQFWEAIQAAPAAQKWGLELPDVARMMNRVTDQRGTWR